jgi:hypothetical protein
MPDLFTWLKPTKPECQSCQLFIFCCIDDVQKCPKLKRSWPDRLWRWAKTFMA